MKIHRFIDDFELSGEEIEVTGEIAYQMAKVLKLEIGEQVDICDGKGNNASGKIRSLSKNSVMIDIDKTWKDKNENKKQVSLFCAVLKKENFELVVQKATECGVSKIIPIITTRTIKTGLNMERLQKIAKEACEQSGRSYLPEISEPVSFEEGLEMAKENDINIIFDASGELLGGLNKKSSPSIWIGPEGGWTPEEIKRAEDNNFKKLSLGSRILRAETAAIVSTFVVNNFI